MLHVRTGTGTVCSTVILHCYMSVQGMDCLQYGNISLIHVGTGTGTVCSTVILHCFMSVQGLELLQYGNSALLHVRTGTGTVCITVILHCFMYVQGLEHLQYGNIALYSCPCRDWNCLQYFNIALIHVRTGTGTVCITVILHCYMSVQGLELFAVR